MAFTFVAVGHNGLRVASPDGLAWSAPALGKEGETYRAVAAGGGRVVAVGTFGPGVVYAATRDGTSWKTGLREMPNAMKDVRGLASGGGTFVALGGALGKPFAMTSRDGEAWDDPRDAKGPPGTHPERCLRRAAWGNGRFVAVGDHGRRAASPDGKTWTEARGKPVPRDALVDVAFGNGVFLGVGLHGLRMTTRDGAEWSAPVRGAEGEHLNAVVWTGDRFVAVGPAVTMTSPDGAAWARHPTGDGPLTVAYGRGVFVGARWKGRLLRSTDGVAWREVYRAPHHVEAVAAL